MNSHDNDNDMLYLKTILGWSSLCLTLIMFLQFTTSVWIPRVIILLCASYSFYSVLTQGYKWWNKRKYKATHRERFLKLLASFMSLSFFFGAYLYLEVLYLKSLRDGIVLVNSELLLRAAMESLSLFVFKVNGILLSGIREHVYLRGGISIMSLIAFMCTIAVLVNLAYSRLMSYLKIKRNTKVDSIHNHVYMFIGLNKASQLLAKSISENDKDRAIIIAIDHIHNKEEDEGGWNSIVKFFTIRKQTYAEIEELDARIAFIDSPLHDLKIEGTEDTDIFELINLSEIRSILTKLPKYEDSELHIFFLSENEEENIRSIGVMARDTTINGMNRKVKQRMYYHARRNGLNRVVEDIALKKELDVCIIDSAHITVEQLKVNPEYHPIKLVDIDDVNPTTVKSKFNSLIVGFSEVGQDSLRFLYEYGAFVDSKSTEEKVLRSQFKCTAVDIKMDEIKGRFKEFLSSFPYENNEEMPEIKLEKYDYHSEDFFDNVIVPNAETLNYVIISLGDDEKSMACAIGLFKYIRKIREDMSKLRIFVRCYSFEKEKYMMSIADHYNEGYNTDCQNESFKTPEIIIPFGKQENVYSYDMIVNDKLITCGQRFQKRYAEMSNEHVFWKERRENALGFKDKEGKEILRQNRRVSLNSIRSVRRKEYQDISNAFHSYTKIYLLKHELNKTDNFDWAYFFARYFDVDGIHADKSGCKKEITYNDLTPEENKIIMNLAWLEHERWIASHHILGYSATKDKELHCCDERTMQHNCMIPWQKLDEESLLSSDENWTCDYKNYDFGVVDVSVQLYKENILG